MISDEAAKFLEALRDYGATIAAPSAAVLGWYLGRHKVHAEAVKLAREGDAAKLDSITRHFEKLIDGYERRTEDLTQEVTSLRKEVVDLRQALDKRPRSTA